MDAGGRFTDRVRPDHTVDSFSLLLSGVVLSSVPHWGGNQVDMPRTFDPKQVASASPSLSLIHI